MTVALAEQNNKRNQDIKADNNKRMRILDDIRPVALISQFCAVVPFVKGSGDNLAVPKEGRLYSYLLCVALIISSGVFSVDVLLNARDYKILKNKQGDTEEINQTIETLFCIISYTMIVISCVHNGAKHCRTFKDIAKIDEHLEANGFDGVYKCPFIAFLLISVSFSVIGVAFFYIHIRSDIDLKKQLTLMTAYSLQMLLSCVFAIYLRIILKNIARRIEFVNKKLESFTNEESKENWRELSNLIEIFCKFRYITENINSVAGVGLLFYMGYAFYTVTNQSYLAFSILTTHVAFMKKFDSMVLSVAWVLAEITTMSVICSSCDAMSSEKMCQSIRQSKPYNKELHPSPNRRNRIFNNDFLRESSRENPVFTDINTMLFILKATGLLPIFEQVSHYEIGPPTKSNDYYSFFVRGIVHGLTVFHLYNLFTPGSSQAFFSYRDSENINQWIEIILSILTYTATVFICGRNADSFLKIINEILKVDEEIRNHYRASLNNNCGFSVKFLVGICICQAYIVGLKIFGRFSTLTPSSYILIGFFAIQNGLSTIFIVFAAALLRIISMRFAYLNLLLNGYTYKQQRKVRRNMRRYGDVAPMESFPEDSLFAFRMHNKLLRIYKSTNDVCSLILVCYMGYAFYTITTNTYNLFVEITQTRRFSMQIVQWGFAWLILHTSLLTLLSRSCGQATREANTTSQILARVYGKSKEYQNIIDKFLTKSIKQEVQFTAYGFFVIDNSTLFKIFSAVTTYLVILIQFKQLEDSKLEDANAAAGGVSIQNTN